MRLRGGQLALELGVLGSVLSTASNMVGSWVAVGRAGGRRGWRLAADGNAGDATVGAGRPRAMTGACGGYFLSAFLA